MTKVMKCPCTHPGQDKLHGPGLRVHNSVNKDPKDVRWRCTACGVEKTAPK